MSNETDNHYGSPDRLIASSPPVGHRETVVRFYDTHPINEDEILQKLALQGKQIEQLTQRDLAQFDQDHYGGTEFLDILLDAAEVSSRHHVLDVCSGMGGPARWTASTRGSQVTGLDFTLSRVESARRLTALVKLDTQVDFVHGDATDMPFEPDRFDILLSQESWLHIPDKERLISECFRVLKPGGTLAFTDIIANMALDADTERQLAVGMHTANLATVDGYVRLIESTGASVMRQDNISSRWKEILVDRLEMFRSLRDTTIAKFGQARFDEYDAAYSHYVDCFTSNKLGGIRIVARKSV
jgi:ubiquinone/menaquinone biosynthesis C-methylase UbiE